MTICFRGLSVQIIWAPLKINPRQKTNPGIALEKGYFTKRAEKTKRYQFQSCKRPHNVQQSSLYFCPVVRVIMPCLQMPCWASGTGHLQGEHSDGGRLSMVISRNFILKKIIICIWNLNRASPDIQDLIIKPGVLTLWVVVFFLFFKVFFDEFVVCLALFWRNGCAALCNSKSSLPSGGGGCNAFHHDQTTKGIC